MGVGRRAIGSSVLFMYVHIIYFSSFLPTDCVTDLDLMDHFRKALPGRVVDVLYEELIQDPKRTMKRVLKEIGVKWEDAILNFHETKRIVHTHSMTRMFPPVSLDVSHCSA